MFKRICAVIGIITLLCAFAGCGRPAAVSSSSEEAVVSSSSQESQPASSSSASAESSGPASKIESVTLTSKAIASNKLEERTERVLTVYLPASYEAGDKAYPVVYYLHGFGDSERSFVGGARRELDKLFADGKGEFILVGVNGNNKSGGSFYVNSPVTGNFEDYVTQEVVDCIDGNYRTLATPASRGICGFSMGGFGAIYLALRHPDIYGAIYAMSPGIAKTSSFDTVLDSWKTDSMVMKAYGQAFAPDPDGESPFCILPKRDGTDADNALLDKWVDGYANWDKKLDDYLAKGTPLHGIGISYGHSDYYRWIPEGCEYFIGLLKQNGIEPSVVAFEGGHVVPPSGVSNQLLPFFRDNLTF